MTSTGEVLPREPDDDAVREAFYERCRHLRIEPPSEGRVGRLLASARGRFESAFHSSVFAALPGKTRLRMDALLASGIELGGAISGEHGIGRHKKPWFLRHTDPVNLRLMRGIKDTFDPNGILNPGAILD